MQNHIIDPTFFFDAIEEFSFDYDIYVKTGKTIDDRGYSVGGFTKEKIRGSLQPTGVSVTRSKSGNIITKDHEFYCKALYRIDIGDILEYKGNYYICTGVSEYDEYGVRSASLKLTTLTAQKDLDAYLKYINGEEII